VQEGGDAMAKPTEHTPEAVSARTRRAGEAPDRWSWVEPTVWTERMLTALDQGVKGGKWFSLIPGDPDSNAGGSDALWLPGL
jgi:hypothetical protein